MSGRQWIGERRNPWGAGLSLALVLTLSSILLLLSGPDDTSGR